MISIFQNTGAVFSRGNAVYAPIAINADAESEITVIEIDDAMSDTSTINDLDNNRSLSNKFYMATGVLASGSGLIGLFTQSLLTSYPMLIVLIVCMDIMALLCLIEGANVR